MKKRSVTQPKITMPIWKPEGKLWYADEADLRMAIERSGVSDSDLRRKLGVGYNALQEALKGKRLEGWTVAHIEWGLTPATPTNAPLVN